MLFSGIIPIEIALHAYKQEKENEILNQIKENSEKKEKIMFEDKTLEQLDVLKSLAERDIVDLKEDIKYSELIISQIEAEIEKRCNDERAN
jgi:hypothetical protein